MARARSTAIPAVFCALLAVLACRSVSGAPATRPDGQRSAVAAPLSSMDSQLIKRGTAQKAAPDSEKSAPSMSLEGPRVGLALAAVVALIFILRAVARRFFGIAGAQRPSGTVQVLSRSIISPRQHILLVQIGRRVLVVGDSGGQMNALCQITDGDEIAALVGQIREERLTSTAKLFGSFFNRAKDQMEDADEQDSPSVEQTDVPESAEAESSSLASTRHELTGLMEKVRLVSRQFHRG